MSHGTVNPDATSAAAGTAVTLTVAPDAGYRLQEGTLKYSYGGSGYDPVGSGLVYIFAMPAANVTVSAAFEPLPPNTYSIAADSSISHGTVSPDVASAAAGTAVTLTVAPEAGYRLQEGTLKYRYGGSGYDPVGSGLVYIFPMPGADVTVSAVFEPLPPNTYSIAAAASMSHGTVNPDVGSATVGTTITLAATPNAGYRLQAGTVAYNDGSDHGIAGPPYTFAMPAANVTVSAAFEAIAYNIAYELNGGTHNAGNPATYTIESAAITLADATRGGYTFGGWYDNAGLTGSPVAGIPQGSTENKTFHAKWNPGAPVQIILQPVPGYSPLSNASIFEDESASFSAAGIGYASWQWRWDGTLIGGANTSAYTLAAGSKPPGIYELSVVATTDEGAMLSARCRVAVKDR
jgi:uncharacterized repeat protein (TIGR02543 family)